jgi:hypothetical protein
MPAPHRNERINIGTETAEQPRQTNTAPPNTDFTLV